jgi:hypothetical protein
VSTVIRMICAVLLVACGSSKPAPQEQEPQDRRSPQEQQQTAIGNLAHDAGVPPPAPGCRATWDGITDAGGCADETTSCDYPEGSCYCGLPPTCSGTDMSDDGWGKTQPPRKGWQCNAVPPAFRDDGCPGVAPEGACSQEGQQCKYGDCCVMWVECKRGQWKRGVAQCPP